MALHSDQLSESTLHNIAQADIIILCGGCNSLPQQILDKKKDGCIVVTHPTLHWRYERNILAEASENNLKVHSLRYDGPLHRF